MICEELKIGFQHEKKIVKDTEQSMSALIIETSGEGEGKGGGVGAGERRVCWEGGRGETEIDYKSPCQTRPLYCSRDAYTDCVGDLAEYKRKIKPSCLMCQTTNCNPWILESCFRAFSEIAFRSCFNRLFL